MPLEYLMWAPVVALSLVLYVTLAIGALFSLNNSGWVSPSSRRGWAAAVVLLPVAGAVLWLASSHRHTVAGTDVPSADFPIADVPVTNVTTTDVTIADVAMADDAGSQKVGPDTITMQPDQQTS